jgi:hypothetical protein
MAQRRGPDGTVRIAIGGLNKDEPFTNVVWCNLVGGTTAPQADLDQYLSVFASAWVDNLAPGASSEVIFNIAQATLFQPNESALHAAVAFSSPGAQTGPQIKNLSTCAVMSWLSTVYWRGGKPRTYLPGVMQASTLDDKTLTPTAAAAYQTAGAALHTALNALTAGSITQSRHGFVSFQSGGVDRNPSKFFEITGCKVHPRLGTQRGRLGPWLA